MRVYALAILALPLCLFGQTSTARLEGTVQDTSGASVPDARIAITASKSRNVISVASDAGGRFVFSALAPDTYELVAEAQGFRKLVVHAIEVNLGETVTQRLTLEIGQVTESVTVTATTVNVQTADAQVSRSVTLREVDALPQLGRSPLSLINFQAGASIDPSNSSYARFNGMRQGMQNIVLDGLSTPEPYAPRTGITGIAFNTDTIEEMRVVSAGGKAEYGRQGGAQVEFVTRTGSNRFSGSAYNYMRNTVLNANNFFSNSNGLQRPSLIQNLFGASFGGPIRKDKTFFFANFQGRRLAQQVVRNRTVPTAEFRQGLFRWTQPNTANVMSYNLPANDPRRAGIDPEVKKLFDLIPLPNNTDIGDRLNSAGFRFNTPAPTSENQGTLRIDHNLTSAHRLFARYSQQKNVVTDTLNSNEARFPGRVNGIQDNLRWGFTVGLDSTISSTVINELRVGYQKPEFLFVRPDRFPGPQLIFNTFTDPINPTFSSGRKTPQREITDNISFLRGKHTIKAGFNARLLRIFNYNEAGIYPNVSLATGNGNVPPSSVGPTGASLISTGDRQRFESLYNDYFGRMSSVTVTYQSDLASYFPIGTPRLRNNNSTDLAGFLQDDFKATRKLTLNYGIRWDYFGSPVERNGLQGSFDRIGQVSPLGGIDNLTVARGGRWYNNDKNNFAPRFGFAYDVFGDGTTAIRGSYGVYFDRIVGAVGNTVDANTPGFTQQVLIFPNSSAGSDRRAGDGIPIPAQPASVLLRQPVTRQTTVIAFDPNLRTEYSQHFSFNIQRQLMRNTVLDVGYVGTKGTGLFNWLDFNQLKVGGDYLTHFQQIEAARLRGAAVPADNVFVRVFGSVNGAVSAIGASVFDQGRAGVAADTTDRQYYTRYAQAGLSPFYLRNFPQFNQFWYGSNFTHSSYHSLQTTLRRQAGALKFNIYYTYSKALDNISDEGNGTTGNVDNFNLRQNRGRSAYDRTHAFAYTAVYALPLGRGRAIGGDWPGWMSTALGGWDAGVLGSWQSGSVYSIFSGRRTNGSAQNSWANFSGDRTMGEVRRTGEGVYFYDAATYSQFSFPGSGEIGNAGRNSFRGPRFFNVDLSLSKRFPIHERHHLQLRMEFYNLFNNTNFAEPAVSLLNSVNYGRITGIEGSPRIMQAALRYNF